MIGTIPAPQSQSIQLLLKIQSMRKKNKPFPHLEDGSILPQTSGSDWVGALSVMGRLAVQPSFSPALHLRQGHTSRYYDKLKDTVISPPTHTYTEHTAESS